MAKKDVIEVLGTVVDAQPNAMFVVKLENGYEVPNARPLHAVPVSK